MIVTPKRIFVLALQAAIVGGLVWAVWSYQSLLDRYALMTFKPSAEVAAMEPRLWLSAKGKGILYRSQPQINNKTDFNKNCETTKGELELGCYYRSRIYVLKISNSSLAAEMDVVMAHELLHAVWARMPKSERNRIGAELKTHYEAHADKELRDRMAGYAKSEPGQETNELHSILGTEAPGLSPVLEAHYAKYLANRSIIVAAHVAYERVFESRRQELERELATVRTLKGQLAIINQQMTSYRTNGQISLYNAMVPRQNQLVDTINQRIELYRQGVDEYNALSRSLDSQGITDTETGVQ